MASAYSRTIEFKVKGQALKQFVDQLGKSLNSIDKSVDKINKQFGKIGNLGKSLKGIGTELKQIAKATQQLGKNIKKTEIVNPKKLSASLLQLKQVKAVLKDLNNTKAAFGSNYRLTDEYNEAAKALKDYIREVANGTKYIAANEQGLNRQAAAFAKVAAASKINSAQYKNAIFAQTKAEQKLRISQLERIHVQETLYKIQDLRTSGQLKQGYDMTGFKGTKGLLGLEDEIMKRNTIASLSTYKQELQNINRFLSIGSDEYKEVEAAIGRIDKVLNARSIKEKELSDQAKKRSKIYQENQKILKDMLRISSQMLRFSGRGLGELFGVLGGKRGAVPQLFAGDVSLEVIKNMIRFVPLLDKKIKDQVRTWAKYGQVATRVLAGIKIASIGLSSVLGGAQWVSSAVQGFISFENAAAKSIWRIQNNWTKFQGVMGAALMFGFNPFGKGGAYDLAMGGADRRESKRYAKQGGTDLQINEKGLDKMNTLLSNRNRTASDYARILGRAVQLEREISQETKLQSIMREHASGKIARDIKKRDIERKKDLRNKRRDRRRSFEQRREDFEFEQAQWAGQTYMGTEAQELMAPGRQGRVRRDVWARYQRRLSSRRQRRSRFNENLMLGAGFPMLFGGGVGSVGGGIAGAAINRSGKGFGGQILLSALGQQLDSFVVKTKELGDALRKPTENLKALRDAAGIAGTDLEKTTKELEALGLKASAAELLTAQIGDFADIKALKGLSDAWQDLSNVFSKLTIQTMSLIAGPITKFMTMMSRALEGTVNATDARAVFDSLGKEDQKKFQEMLAQLMPSAAPRNMAEKYLDPFGKGTFQRAVAQGIPQDVWKQLKIAFDPESAPALQAGLSGKIAQMQGADNNDLAEKVKLEENRLNMSSNEFAIKEKELEINRQNLEIQWQAEEYFKMEEGMEKDALARKIKKLHLEKQMNQALLKNLEAGTKIEQVYAGIAATIEDGLVNAIEGAIRGTKTLGDVATSVFSQIARSMLQLGVNSLLGMIPGKLGTYFKGKAAGGPVTGDTPYIVGEKGPELFVPNSSGNIVPNHAMGGSMVVNVDASGSSAEGDDDRSRQLGELIGAAVQSEIIRQQRPGGTLY